MSFVITEIEHFSEFTGTAVDGTAYPNTGVMAKPTVWIRGYSYLAFIGKTLTFNAAEKTITNANLLDFSSFKNDGDKVGKGLAPNREIYIEGSALNDDTYTVVSISEDGRTITVLEALVNEVAVQDVDIFDDTPVTAMDLSYNLIENNEEESYLSKTDKGAIQRFTVDGIASGSATPVPMLVSSSSLGWVTNELSNETTGETSEVTVQGADISAHKQQFLIKQVLRIAPFFTADQINDFRNGNPVTYFKDGKALKYICKIDAKFDFTDPTIPHTGKSIDTPGLTCFFGQNNIRSRAEYYLDSISYTGPDSEELDSIDIDKVVDVSITIKSRNGKFAAYGSDEDSTKIALDFCYAPLNESRYVFTPNTTLRQNFLNDRKFMFIGVGANGEYDGTAYQVLKQIEADYIDAETMEVNFKVDFAAEIKTFLKTLAEANRNFFFCVTTQDTTIETTVQSDNVPVITPINQIAWDKSDPELVEAVDNARIYIFPDKGENPKTSLAGWEGDPFYVEFPHRVESASVAEVTPTILSAGFQIVVRKTGEDNFVLEEKIFDTSQVRKLEGVQTIDFSESKNYRDMEDEYNTCSLARDSSFDVGSMKGFLASHASVLRYAYWSKLIADSDRFQYDLFKEIENPTEAWNTLQQNGWSLAIRFVSTVQGYTGFSEEFDHYWDIDCKAVGDEPDAGPAWTSEVTYEDYATGIRTKGITPGGKTLITRTYTANFETMPEGYDEIFAYIFDDLKDIGGAQNRRFASTEYDSEDDSPFSAPDADPDADQSWASANVRINIFNFTRITVTTILNDVSDAESGWSTRAGSVLIYPRLGGFGGCFVLNENGEYTIGEAGNRIALEECPEDVSS